MGLIAYSIRAIVAHASLGCRVATCLLCVGPCEHEGESQENSRGLQRSYGQTSSHESLEGWQATPCQWAAWRCPVQRKRVITFRQSKSRVRSLGLPATTKARKV
eukprot:5912452-Amphidinium_carterae.2